MTDPLLHALADLAAAPPRALVDTVYGEWTVLASPAGEVYVAFTDHGVSYLRTAESVGGDAAEFRRAHRRRFDRPLRRAAAPPPGLVPALNGRPTRALRLDLRGLTPFQRAVLAAARRIPAGQTRPYNWVAREVGSPRAVRAVGTALARNPVPVLVPCHRVTPSSGEPGAYVFGGALKERLLRSEHVDLDRVRALAGGRVYFIGSDTTGVVCYPTCAAARRITRAHLRGFRDMPAAVRAGYRPCRVCRPVAAQP